MNGARSFDVLVVGGGLAGAVAAKKAAEQGKSVGLVRAGGGATVHSSGAFGIVAEPSDRSPEGSPPLVDSIRHLLRRNPHHPYALVAREASALQGLLEEATEDLFGDLGGENLFYRGSLARNMWLATPCGHVLEAAFAQHSIAQANLSALSKARIAVVAVGARAEPEAKARASNLRRTLDGMGFFGIKEILPCPVAALPEGAGVAPDEPGIARALDDEGTCAAWAKEVARAVENFAPRATHLLFAPVLGLREPGVASATIARETGREVAETVGLPPSVPGLRLERALCSVLARKGVTVLCGRAVRAEAERGSVRRISLDSPYGPEELTARSFVLASGKFLGGGLREQNRIVEPLFDLPLFCRGRPLEELSPEERFERHVGGPHAAFEAGIRCDIDLRPYGREGGLAFENLYAAGAVLQGTSFCTDRGGLGVSLATGYIAGLNGAEAG